MTAGAGDTDPVLEMMAVLGIFHHHADPWHLPMPGQGQQELGDLLG